MKHTVLFMMALSAAIIPVSGGASGGPLVKHIQKPGPQVQKSRASRGATLPVPNQPLIVPVQPSAGPVYDRKIAQVRRELDPFPLGTPLVAVVRVIRQLGGVEDGGMQSIPPARYYIDPYIIVDVPVDQDHHLSGQVRIHYGRMAYD